MNDVLSGLLRRIRGLEDKAELELAKRRLEFSFAVHQGKVRFEQAILARHRAMKTHVLRYVLDARPVMLLTAPIVYAMVVPLVLLDLFLAQYQTICFRVYGIEKVRRSDYLIYDRSQLAYLNAIEKLNCAYCSDANGLIGYLREIAARTEQHWCPIKHARRVVAAHQHYATFVDYGDAAAYQQELPELRRQLRHHEPADKPEEPGRA
jgi:hypothetical protein